MGVLATCLVISFALQPRAASPVIAFPLYRGGDLSEQSYMVLSAVPVSYERAANGLDQSRKELQQRQLLLRELDDSMAF